MVAPQTLLDLKYILVSVDFISGNQVGNVNRVSQIIRVFLLWIIPFRSTNNGMTEKII